MEGGGVFRLLEAMERGRRKRTSIPGGLRVLESAVFEGLFKERWLCVGGTEREGICCGFSE